MYSLSKMGDRVTRDALSNIEDLEDKEQNYQSIFWILMDAIRYQCPTLIFRSFDRLTDDGYRSIIQNCVEITTNDSHYTQYHTFKNDEQREESIKSIEISLDDLFHNVKAKYVIDYKYEILKNINTISNNSWIKMYDNNKDCLIPVVLTRTERRQDKLLMYRVTGFVNITRRWNWLWTCLVDVKITETLYTIDLNTLVHVFKQNNMLYLDLEE